VKRTAGNFSRTKKGKKTWWARLVYWEESGKRRELQRRAEGRAHARELAEQLAREYDESGGRAHAAARMTFRELAAYCEEHYYKPAEYRDERKIQGVRGLATVMSQLKVLKEYFGAKPLRSITYADLRAFRAHRLQTASTKTGKPLSIASVNRELSTLRRLLNVAQAEGWILRNPFAAGDPLINIADERRRERIVSRDEEARLLLACVERQRQHLRPLLIAALDTGMRRGELLKLRWPDVDFARILIHVRAFHTKTMTARDVPISRRLLAELQRLWDVSSQDPEGLVFGIRDGVRVAFNSARIDAGLADVRFHDLRHTAATRLTAKGLELAEVGRILGHSQPKTTYRYMNPDESTLRRAAAALDAFNEEGDTAAAGGTAEEQGLIN
jgi:integrase